MWNELLVKMLDFFNEIINSYSTDVDPRTSTEDTAIPHVSLLGLDGIILEPVCRC